MLLSLYSKSTYADLNLMTALCIKQFSNRFRTECDLDACKSAKSPIRDVMLFYCYGLTAATRQDLYTNAIKGTARDWQIIAQKQYTREGPQVQWKKNKHG